MSRSISKGYFSLFSQLYHYLLYSTKKIRETRLGKAMLITSIDIDVGDKKLGLKNQGKNDANVNRYISEYRIGEIEERALPLFLEAFNRFELPATFAIRGQLTEVKAAILNLLLESSAEHDIGAHGYYHKKFTNLTRDEAESELKLISVGMKKFGIVPQTFIFPANCVAHLELLEKHGYKCYRGHGGFKNDDMWIEKKGKLYNIHPSLYIDQYTNPSFLTKILHISIVNKLPFHIWFHLWNFGETQSSMNRSVNNLFVPFFSCVREEERNGRLACETMLSATERVEIEG